MIKRVIYIIYFLEVGLLLLLVPWSGFWERNYFVHRAPALRGVVGNHFVRGGVSGLGLWNLGLGVVELGGMVWSRRLRFGPPSPPA